MRITKEAPLVALAITLPFIGGACGGEGTSPKPTPIVRPSGAAGLTPLGEIQLFPSVQEESSLKKEAADLISKYYPEVSGRPINAAHEIKTGRSNKIINLSSAAVDVGSVTKLLSYYENLVKTPKQIDYLNQPFLLIGSQEPNYSIFLVPKGTPAPYWESRKPGELGDYIAATTTKGERKISYVQITNSPKDADEKSYFMYRNLSAVNSSMFVNEIGQSYLTIGASDARSEFAQVGQELVPFSFTLAVAAKMEGYSYQDYKIQAGKFKLRLYSNTPSYPMYALSEKEYDEIPFVSFPLKLSGK